MNINVITTAFQTAFPLTTTSTYIQSQPSISPRIRLQSKYQTFDYNPARMNPEATVAVPSEPTSTPSPSDDNSSTAPWMPLPGTAHTITTPEEFDRILEVSAQNNTLLVADFMASWCRKCKYLLPRFKKIAASRETVYFCTVDVNKVHRLPKQYSITNMPTFLFFKDGKEVHRVIGGATPQKVADEMQGKIDRLLL